MFEIKNRHMDERRSEMITQFSGPHRFLSNFWPAQVRMSDIVYRTVEHAYQAAKTQDASLRFEIQMARTPGEAKRLARKYNLPPRPDRLEVMEVLVRAKFKHPPLARQLLATGDKRLIEGNTWHDNYWGCCTCCKCPGKGTNHLGRILEKVRSELK